MTAAITQARDELVRFLASFPFACRKEADGTVLIASIDRTGQPGVATMLTIKPDGEASVERRRTSSLSKNVFDAFMAGNTPMKFEFSEGLEWFGARGAPSGFARQLASAFTIRHSNTPLSEAEIYEVAAAHMTAADVPSALKSLNAVAIRALRAVSSFNDVAYSFYASPSRGEIRRQAADAYPLLAFDLAAKPTLKITIDMKGALADALEKAYGATDTGLPKMSKALLRRIAGKDWNDRGVTPALMCEVLSRMPAEWFPKDKAEFDAFLDLTNGPFRLLAIELPDSVSSLVEGCGGKWADLRMRAARGAASTQVPDDIPEDKMKAWRPTGDESPEGLMASGRQALDMLHAFRDQVVLPIAASAAGDVDVYLGSQSRRIATDAAARILFPKKSLTAVMESQRDWHARANEIIAALGQSEKRKVVLKEVAEDGWPPLTDEVVAPNGVICQPLTDPRELDAESAELGHCVGGGGYDSKAKRGDSHIVSYRMEKHDDDKRTSLATAEFGRIDPNSDTLKELQVQGSTKKSRSVPQNAMDAHKWYMSEVAAGRIMLNRDGIMTYLGGKSKSSCDVVNQAGYDRKDLETVDDVLNAWRPLLPKRLRSMTLEQIRELPEMTDTVEALAPSFAPARRL